MKWLRRYLDERDPTFEAFAKAVATLSRRDRSDVDIETAGPKDNL